MIVVGIDPHKRTHTAVALERRTGERVGTLSVPASPEGASRLLAWALTLDGEALFALEDCRHVSGALERFLLARSQGVVPIAPRLMAQSRRSARKRGKSDVIDADAVARAYLREPSLPRARRDPAAAELKLLSDHRDDLVQERTRKQNRLRWHLHELELGTELPAGALDRCCWQERLAASLGALPKTRQVAISLELLADVVALSRRAKELEREIECLVKQTAPELLELPGCAALSAGKILAEVGARERFSDDAALALHAGVAPLEASSGSQRRHRLNRSGNRQLNCALHRVAVAQGRSYAPARAYLERRQSEGKTRREALRALKRHLARTVYRILRESPGRQACQRVPREAALT